MEACSESKGDLKLHINTWVFFIQFDNRGQKATLLLEDAFYFIWLSVHFLWSLLIIQRHILCPMLIFPKEFPGVL